MLTPIAWHEVQEPPLGCFAIAGVKARLFLACAAESACGVKAFLYAKAATVESVTTTIRAQIKTANGQGRTRSRVGIQLNRILPGRGGVCGCSGDGRPAFSRVRLSQNILSELAASVDAAAIRFGMTNGSVVETRILCDCSRSET